MSRKMTKRNKPPMKHSCKICGEFEDKVTLIPFLKDSFIFYMCPKCRREEVRELKQKEEDKLRQFYSDREFNNALKENGTYWDKTCTCEYCPIHNNAKFKGVLKHRTNFIVS